MMLRLRTREEELIADIVRFLRSQMRLAWGDAAMRFEIARRAWAKC